MASRFVRVERSQKETMPSPSSVLAKFARNDEPSVCVVGERPSHSALLTLMRPVGSACSGVRVVALVSLFCGPS